MINIKWSGIAAGAAFATALLLSLLLGQTSLSIALLRAAIFAALFFGLGTAAWALINTFVPELLSSNTGGGDIASNLFSTGAAGSRVNITVDDTQNAALPAALPEQDRGASDGEVGDFNELFTQRNTAAGDIDQIPTTGYTGEGEFASEMEESSSGADGLASAFSDIGLNSEEEEETSDFSMDFNAFVPGGVGGDGDKKEGKSEPDSSDVDPFSFFPGGSSSTSFEEPDISERKASRNKPMKLEGDFDAREIAAGLRTVLQKDKK